MSRHATFENFGMAFLTLFQVSTGDNWNGIMKVQAGAAGGTMGAPGVGACKRRWEPAHRPLPLQQVQALL